MRVLIACEFSGIVREEFRKLGHDAVSCDLLPSEIPRPLFRRFEASPIPRIAIENQIMHGYGLEIIGRRPTQIVQPWMFGHGETKATCLWLKNLPPLRATQIVSGRKGRVHKESPGPARWKNRSRTYAGLAAAMATQWCGLYAEVGRAA